MDQPGPGPTRPCQRGPSPSPTPEGLTYTPLPVLNSSHSWAPEGMRLYSSVTLRLGTAVKREEALSKTQVRGRAFTRDREGCP